MLIRLLGLIVCICSLLWLLRSSAKRRKGPGSTFALDKYESSHNPIISAPLRHPPVSSVSLPQLFFYHSSPPLSSLGSRLFHASSLSGTPSLPPFLPPFVPSLPPSSPLLRHRWSEKNLEAEKPEEWWRPEAGAEAGCFRGRGRKKKGGALFAVGHQDKGSRDALIVNWKDFIMLSPVKGHRVGELYLILLNESEAVSLLCVRLWATNRLQVFFLHTGYNPHVTHHLSIKSTKESKLTWFHLFFSSYASSLICLNLWLTVQRRRMTGEVGWLYYEQHRVE